MRIRLTVTKEDIAKGQRRSGSACPVALALKRRFLRVSVGCGGFAVAIQDKHEDRLTQMGGNLTCKAEEFVTTFDTTGKGRPFSTVLTANESGYPFLL